MSMRSEKCIFFFSKPELLNRSASEPCGSSKDDTLEGQLTGSVSGSLAEALVEPLSAAQALLSGQERVHPYIFASLKSALHPLISAR